jgi:hypothetical protein
MRSKRRLELLATPTPAPEDKRAKRDMKAAAKRKRDAAGDALAKKNHPFWSR